MSGDCVAQASPKLHSGLVQLPSLLSRGRAVPTYLLLLRQGSWRQPCPQEPHSPVGSHKDFITGGTMSPECTGVVTALQGDFQENELR